MPQALSRALFRRHTTDLRCNTQRAAGLRIHDDIENTTIAAAQVGIGETVRALAVVILDDVGETESRDNVSTCIGQNDPAAHMFGALGSRMPWTRIARTRQIIGTPAN